MATEQTSSNAEIVQAVAEAATEAIQARTMAEAERSQNVGLKQSGHIMKQLVFDWNLTDKYAELRNFRSEVRKIFQNYRISQAERVPIIKNWLGRQGLQLLESLPQTKQEVGNKEEGLFEMLNNKFKPQYNETINSTISQANGMSKLKYRRMVWQN